MAKKKIEIRTEEVNEIMQTPPSLLVSWGTSAVFLTIITLAFLAWYIKYPDIIYERITLTSPNPPIAVVMEKGAVVEQFNVKKDDIVKEGDLLFVLENKAEYTHVMLLDSVVEKWMKSGVNVSNLPSRLVLGQLEYPLNQLKKEIKDLSFTKNNNLPAANISELEQLIGKERRLIAAEQIKRPDIERRLNTAETILGRKLKLLQQGMIAQREYSRYVTDVNIEKEKLKDIAVNIRTHERNISQYQTQIVAVRQGNSEGENAKNIAVLDALNQLESSIQNWKSNYLITANFDGKIAIYEDWQAHQFIEQNTEVLTIEPESNGVIGHLTLSANSAGKVKPGQAVAVKLDGYPYMEYGVLNGQIDEVAEVPKESRYPVTVTFDYGMKTNLGNAVNLTQRMEGGAEIVTEEKRLSERILDRLTKAYENFIG